ncbi:MAG: CDP-alcohol phosphatidyltransferase family protein [Deltaproteobacteria bacterium]|nr:CDP-alcohol phosphatidyltransferase family protein [Deltaproteobacteria bacterium]
MPTTLNAMDGKCASQVFLIRRRDSSIFRVGGLALEERWQRALNHEGVGCTVLEGREEWKATKGLTDPAAFIDENSVFEHTTLVTILHTRCRDNEAVVFQSKAGDPAPAVLLGPNALRRVTNSDGESPDGTSAIRELSPVADVPVRSVELDDQAFWLRLTKPGQDRAATRELLSRLRTRPGGLIARKVNRHLSTLLSGWLLDTPITPNGITTLSGLLAVGAAALMVLPGYWWAVAAAAVMQASSILDGCDGEVARLRYQSSEFGKWYDSAVDEVVNALFIAATGYHLAQGGWPGWVWVGVFVGAANYLYGMINFHCKWKTGLGIYWWFDTGSRPVKPGNTYATHSDNTSFWSEVKTLYGRDAYLLFFLVAALVDGLPVLMGILAVVAAVIVVLLFLHVVVFRAPC